jgi:hypothetical protein
MGVDLGVATYLCGLMVVLLLICFFGQMRLKSKE